MFLFLEEGFFWSWFLLTLNGCWLIWRQGLNYWSSTYEKYVLFKTAPACILLEVTQKRIGALLLFSFGWWIMEKALNVHIRTFIIHEFEFDYYNWKICEQRCKVFFKMINQSPFADHQRHYYYYYITSTARWSI